MQKVCVHVNVPMQPPTRGFSTHGGGGLPQRLPKAEGVEQGCIRRAGTAEAAPEAARQAVGGDCQSGWGRLQMPLRLALAVRETVAGHKLGALEQVGGLPPPLLMHPLGLGWVYVQHRIGRH